MKTPGGGAPHALQPFVYFKCEHLYSGFGGGGCLFRCIDVHGENLTLAFQGAKGGAGGTAYHIKKSCVSCVHASCPCEHS
jgi:hypothetical protein